MPILIAILLCGLCLPTLASAEYASGLPWHTDLTSAQSAARASGKPILCLRLLGRLDQELSCANSRFFRAILYSDPHIAATMARDFVLCWTSERPVPQLRIDFGDGRVVETTITGNSAHYCLDAEARVIDVLPGLVAPTHFTAWLERMQVLHTRLHTEADVDMTAWHRERARILAEERQAAMQAAGIDAALIETIEARIGLPALDAGALAMSKRAVEAPVLIAAMREVRAQEYFSVWTPVADTLVIDSTLSKEAEALLRRQHHDAEEDAALEQFITDLRIDTARNSWRLHPIIHQWLAETPRPDFASFNRRIYAELFLTPADDPWLGLDPHARISGLASGGLR